MNHPTDKIAYTMSMTLVEHWLEQETAQWVHHEGMLYHKATSHSPTSCAMLSNQQQCFIDREAHNTVVDTPVVEHWLE